jgi:hypothetical protein
LISRAAANQLGFRAIEAEEIAKLPNLSSGPHNPGLHIPYFDLDGKRLKIADAKSGIPIPMCRVRYLPLLVSSGFAAMVGKKDQKYTQPRHVGCPVYIPSLKGTNWRGIADDPEKEIWIVEGELKAAAATLHGVPTLGIGGIWNFKGAERPLSDAFYEFKMEGRSIVLVYDSDRATNFNVRYASDALARELTRLGGKVCTITMPPLRGLKKVGLDDFLKRHSRNPGKALENLRHSAATWVDSPMNDTGNTARFVGLYGDRLFFAREEKSWRLWDGKLWVPNRTHEVLAMTERVSAELRDEAEQLEDEQAKKEAKNWHPKRKRGTAPSHS